MKCISFHSTGRHELNKLTSLPKCGFTAQVVEHRTGIAEVTGSNFTTQNAKIVACTLSFRKSRYKPNLKRASKYGFSADLGGKKWRNFEHAHASYPGLFFSPAWVQPLYGAGRKESSGTGYFSGFFLPIA